jgi:hypothetical protein
MLGDCVILNAQPIGRELSLCEQGLLRVANWRVVWLPRCGLHAFRLSNIQSEDVASPPGFGSRGLSPAEANWNSSIVGLDDLTDATTLWEVHSAIFLLPLPMHQINSAAEQDLSLLLPVQINLSKN